MAGLLSYSRYLQSVAARTSVLALQTCWSVLAGIPGYLDITFRNLEKRTCRESFKEVNACAVLLLRALSGTALAALPVRAACPIADACVRVCSSGGANAFPVPASVLSCALCVLSKHDVCTSCRRRKNHGRQRGA